MLAVLTLLLAGPIVAETRQASISSTGSLMRSSARRSAPGAEAAAEAALTTARGNSSFLSLASSHHADSTQSAPDLTGWIQNPFAGKDPPPQKAPPTEYLLFNWDAGGAWDGDRNDLDAEVGFEFSPLKNLNITALGRHVAGRWDQLDDNMTGPGRNLFARTNVTLWYVIPPGMKLQKGKDPNVDLKLLSVFVGPEDEPEVGGKYNFKYLDKPFPIHAHQRYRITQTSWKGMDDVWFDGVALDSDVWAYSLVECVSVYEGVHSNKKHEYPDRIEHLHRRLGMLNFRVESDEGCGIALPVNAKENAKNVR